jgi:hypothetical protein
MNNLASNNYLSFIEVCLTFIHDLLKILSVKRKKETRNYKK